MILVRFCRKENTLWYNFDTIMMAGVEGNGVEQHRIDKVQIIHAGEDLERVLQPLAVVLEEQLKLGQQVEWRRHFKQDIDIASHIADSISTGREDKGVVVVFSEKFNNEMSKNPAASDRIKTILSQERHALKIALVTIGASSVPCSKPCINIGNYAKMDEGALAEAIYKQWFGPEARLTSQAEMSMNGLVNTDAAQEDYAPCKVKIIHAFQDLDSKMHKRHLADAIDAVVDPEETTSSRIKFMSDQSIAQTVLGDVERFHQCRSESPRVHAVFVWCEVMLNALKQDPVAKTKVIDAVCRDTSHQKLFAHFLFGVTRQEISTFSTVLSEFLIKYGHTVILESLNYHKPALENYMPFAQTFLRIWAGSMKVPKDPEESLDPTMNSLESVESLSPLTSRKPDTRSPQSNPHQNNTGDRLVFNNGSISHSAAVRTQQMGKVLRDSDTSFVSQGRMVTSNGSWDPQLEKAVKYTRVLESDGHSNPPENWKHHSLHGLSFSEDPSTPNREAVPVRQPTDNVDGKNRMAAGSMGSVSVSCVTGPKMTGMKIPTTSSESSGRCAHSLPPSGGQQKSQQPSTRVPGEHYGKNKVAASGFMSYSVCGSSTRSDSSMSQGGVDQPATSGAGLRDLDVPVGNSLGQVDNLSIGDNPVRIVSDSDVLTSADAHQLDDAMRTFQTTSLGATSSLRSDLPSLADTDIIGSVAQGNPTMSSASDDSNLTCRQQDSGNRLMSAPVGRNPLQDAVSTCGSVSLPYPGANSNAAQYGLPSSAVSTCRSVSLSYPGLNSNAAQYGLPSGNGINSVRSEAGDNFQEDLGQQTPEDTLLSELQQPIIRGLKIRLDPPKQTVADWQDLASNFGVDNVLITYWKGQKSDCSPFEQLLTWLKAEKQHLTVKDLKVLLEKVKRRDVLRFLADQGF